MSYIGIMCPNASGHLNPMIALADALRTRGHRVTFFLLGDPPASVKTAGFQIVLLGGSIFPPDQYRAGLQQLGSLQGRAALKQTFAMGARAAEAILKVGPTAARAAGITALLVDQASFPGGDRSRRTRNPVRDGVQCVTPSLRTHSSAVLYSLGTPKQLVLANP